MAPIWIFAALATLSGLLASRSGDPNVAQLGVTLLLGFTAMCAGAIVWWFLREPTVRRHRHIGRIALYLVAAIAFIPFAGMVATVSILSALPLLILAPLFFLRAPEHPPPRRIRQPARDAGHARPLARASCLKASARRGRLDLADVRVRSGPRCAAAE